LYNSGARAWGGWRGKLEGLGLGRFVLQ